MAGFKIALEGVEELENRLNQLNSVRWEAVRKKQTAQMLNRARQSGGTPVSTEKNQAKRAAWRTQTIIKQFWRRSRVYQGIRPACGIRT